MSESDFSDLFFLSPEARDVGSRMHHLCLTTASSSFESPLGLVAVSERPKDFLSEKKITKRLGVIRNQMIHLSKD